MEGTDRLLARLTSDDIAAVQQTLGARERPVWDGASESERRRLTISFGVWHRVPGVLERTGLNPAQPPEDVHAMARGPLTAGGSLYYADMLADQLRSVGSSMEDVRRGLDFGCSSGRVVRAVKAIWPEGEWHGVDPNAEAIGWAREELEGISFAVSPQEPPLPFPDGHFDLAVAISIWSHYGERAARAWLDELHRIVAPGGRAIITTHGLQSLAHYERTGERTVAQLHEIRHAMYRDGFWFAPEFGEQGDWGVRHAEWGTAFLTPEWLIRAAAPAWAIEHLAVGGNADNQDVYLLLRR